MRRALAILILAALTCAPARAQGQPTMLEALAELVHEAMPPTTWSGPHDTWGSLSARISILMHWHLAPPDEPETAEITRRGWLSAGGQQVGVTAYGEGEKVSSLVFEIAGSPFGPDPDDRELLAALAARGVTVADTQRRSYPALAEDTPVARVIHTLAAKDRSPTKLSSSTHCTPPMSRAARMCWVTFELTLGG